MLVVVFAIFVVVVAVFERQSFNNSSRFEVNTRTETQTVP